MSKLIRTTDRVYYYPFDDTKDRPILGYIRGYEFSVAVDAGHSAEHVADFYAAIEREGLPLPEVTVITHWHWDHTFGMHAVHGLCLANERTNQYLDAFRKRLETEGTAFFLEMDERIRNEYEDGKPVVVTPADLVFRGEMLLDAGNCPIRVFQAEAPHTDDSTLIEIPGEKLLILGDCTGGAFPEWTVDQTLADKLAQTVREINPEICLPGHWSPLSPEIIIQDLQEGEG